MDQQVEASNAYGKRPNKLLWTGGGHANPGKRAGNLAKRMKANLRTALVEMLSKAKPCPSPKVVINTGCRSMTRAAEILFRNAI
jgi:hypothetical protein